jgi:hypothetical protein
MNKNDQGDYPSKQNPKTEAEVPRTLKNQNLGHNAKKEGLGPNTKR